MNTANATTIVGPDGGASLSADSGPTQEPAVSARTKTTSPDRLVRVPGHAH